MRPGDGRVIPNFIVQALGGEPLTVYGSGHQTRSFCYVEDMVEGIVRVLLEDSDTTVGQRASSDIMPHSPPPDNQPPSIHNPINLGNPQELSVLELARLVLKLTGSESTVEFRPLPSDDPRVRRPDISRAKALLGWEPKVGIEDGLVRTIRYMSEQNLS